jgi:3',5'-cyclic AMP phosphodiesterase CpdA
LLIHAGDMSSMGYKHEVQQFLKWFNGLDNYTHKIFIAGNHDW